jgi:hypothetical protein
MMHRNPGAARFAAIAVLVLAGAFLAGCGNGAPPRLIACDVGKGPCAADTALGRIELELTPRPIPAMQPLRVAVSSGEPLDEVRLHLSGRDMDMGPNQTRLGSQGPLRWQGLATIPVCVTGRMRWEATLDIRRGDRKESVRFGFDAG